jgi:hypothetical protein
VVICCRVGTSSRVRDTFVLHVRSKSAMSPFSVSESKTICAAEVWEFVKGDVDFWVQLAPAAPGPDRLESRCCLGQMFLLVPAVVLVPAVESLRVTRVIDLRTKMKSAVIGNSDSRGSQ